MGKFASAISTWTIKGLGLGALLLLLALVVSNVQSINYTVPHQHGEDKCNHYSHYIAEPKPLCWFHQTVGNAETLWTAVASMVGVLALWGIYEQIRATESANNAASRSAQAAEAANVVANKSAKAAEDSVNLYAAVERGTPNVRHAYVETLPGGVYVLHFTIENIGRGPLVIKKVWRNSLPTAVDKFPEGITGNEPIIDVYIPLKPGASCSTFAADGTVMVINVPPWDKKVAQRWLAKDWIYFRGCIHYETLGQMRVFAFTLRSINGETTFSHVQGTIYYFDRPLT